MTLRKICRRSFTAVAIGCVMTAAVRVSAQQAPLQTSERTTPRPVRQPPPPQPAAQPSPPVRPRPAYLSNAAN